MSILYFKAWDKKNKQMTKVFTLKDLVSPKNKRKNEFYSRHKDFVILQTIGLRDINGKKIFVGDIVEWENNFANTSFPMREIIEGVSDMYDLKDSSEMDTMIVIGNIYENKDLIKYV